MTDIYDAADVIEKMAGAILQIDGNIKLCYSNSFSLLKYLRNLIVFVKC